MFRKWIVLGTAVLILAATAGNQRLGADEPAEPSRPRRWWDPFDFFRNEPAMPPRYLPLPRVDDGEHGDELVDRGVPQGSEPRPADPRPQTVAFPLTSGKFDFMPIDYSFDEIVDQQ